jgi:hypothetical protein
MSGWTMKLAPAALLAIGRRDYHRRLVRRSGVGIDCGGGLGAEISNFGVKLQSCDAMGALLARELHAALNALDSIGFHSMNCSCHGDEGVDAMVGQRR